MQPFPLRLPSLNPMKNVSSKTNVDPLRMSEWGHAHFCLKEILGTVFRENSETKTKKKLENLFSIDFYYFRFLPKSNFDILC